MHPRSTSSRLALTLATCLLAAWAFATSASAQTHAGDILVIDTDVPPISTAVLFGVDPQTGARTVLHSFGGSNPTGVAVEADGGILITDTDAGTDPSGGTSEWGVLYRLSPDPVTGELVRSELTDFGVGANTGRTPRAVAVEVDGQILVLNGSGGTSNRPLLVRVDPVTGARAIVSDFGNSSQSELGVEPRGVAVEAGGAIVVIDAQAGQGETGNGLGVLFRIDPQTGSRVSVSNFGVGANQGSNPTSLAVEASGEILVTDEGHTSTTPLGLLFRVDPQTGLRSILSDFNTGANAGREPEGVALEADGQILVVDKHAGPLTRGMLFRVDPQTGARAIVSDFGVGPNGGGDPSAVAVVPPRQGTLMVVNEVVNDNGGAAIASDWTVSVSGGNPTPASFPGSGAPGRPVTLEPGAYSASASGPAGYATDFSAECGGTIAGGETRTCTITHDDQPGTLVVINEVVNDNGGTAVASDWTVIVTGGNPAPASFPGSGAPGTTVSLDRGSYSVVLARGLTGYVNSFSPGCGGTITSGERGTCTITHDDEAAALRVINEVVNDSGGTAVPSDWSVVVSGANPVPTSFAGAASPGTTVALSAGAYAVSASGPRGYASTLSSDCAGTIAAGDTKTCTITHRDVPPRLTVINRVINDDGGAAFPWNWTITRYNSILPPIWFPGDDRGTEVFVLPGPYEVLASGPPGYTSTASAECRGAIDIGDELVCTFAHDDQPATLRVVNEVVNDDGASAVPGDFTVTVTGGDPTPASFPGEGVPGKDVTLDAGTYSVNVIGPPGYTSTLSPDCGGTIGLAETKTCTIRSDDQPATLVVVNDVINHDGGTALPSGWTMTVSGANPVPASFPGAAFPGTTVSLDPGAYSVSANGPAGYSSSPSADCAGTIASGQTKTCTIAHEDQSATLRVHVEVLNDDGGTAVASGWTIAVAGENPMPASFPGSHNTIVTLFSGTYSVSESGPAGYRSTLSPDCAGTIGPGETRTCLIRLDDHPPGVPTCDGKLATLVAPPGQVLVQGTPGDDVIVALVGNIYVRGRDGNDTICTGAGLNLIEGGPGDDTIIDAGGRNTARGEAGRDSITTGDAPDVITGGDGNDTINAGGGDDWIDGQGEGDAAVGGAGNDLLAGGFGDDILTDVDGHNVVVGHAGSDTITTGDGNDQIEAGSGNDAVYAGEGANRVDGQGESDTIATGAGDDRIDGGAGSDTITDSGGRNTVQGNDGNDVITTGAGNDQVNGGFGNDVIDAGGGNNSVNGHEGDDILIAGTGDDLIDGRRGFDACRPGTGLNRVIGCEVIT